MSRRYEAAREANISGRAIADAAQGTQVLLYPRRSTRPCTDIETRPSDRRLGKRGLSQPMLHGREQESGAALLRISLQCGDCTGAPKDFQGYHSVSDLTTAQRACCSGRQRVVPGLCRPRPSKAPWPAGELAIRRPVRVESDAGRGVGRDLHAGPTRAQGIHRAVHSYRAFAAIRPGGLSAAGPSCGAPMSD